VYFGLNYFKHHILCAVMLSHCFRFCLCVKSCVYLVGISVFDTYILLWCTYEGRLISNAHSEIFCQRSKVAMRAQCVLVATTLLHSGAKFHFFLYTGSKTVRVNMESCGGGMSTRLQQRTVILRGRSISF